MSDILKFVTHADTLANDPQGNLLGLDAWSEDLAVEIAAGMGLTMTDAHWAVVRFLRDCYRDYGDEVSAREVSRMLAEKFATTGGSRRLYQLFPGGPVSQGSCIAGLPMPANPVDRSSGFRH